MIGAIRPYQSGSGFAFELYLFRHNKPAIKVFLADVFRLFVHGRHCMRFMRMLLLRERNGQLIRIYVVFYLIR